MKLSINQLKYFKSLHERKYRQKYHKFMVEGVKLANEVLQAHSHPIETVVAVPDWLDANAALLAQVGNVVPVSEAELKKISLLSTPNQVFMVVAQPDLVFDVKTVTTAPILYLDDIRDPGNLGTILRIADWFGIPWVVCSPGSVEAYNPKVVQAGMGAFLRVKCVEMDFDALCSQLPGLPAYGTVLEGVSMTEVPLLSPSIIAIGNESQGLSAAVQEKLTHRIAIPKGPDGGAESLNAAVATGIVVSQFVMQRPGPEAHG
jgi:TrmH family RNA methyltransferase